MIVTWRSLVSKLCTSVTSSRLTVVFCCLLQTFFPQFFRLLKGLKPTKFVLPGTYPYRQFVIFHAFQWGNSPNLYKICCWNSQHMMQRHPHLSPVKVCEQEFHNTLTLVITLDIEPTLLVAIRQRFWWYQCSYKHKIVFDMGSPTLWVGISSWRHSMGQRLLPVQKHLSSTHCRCISSNVLAAAIESLCIKKGTCFITRRMRWAGHVARMGEERGCIGSWWGNRREGDHWGDLA